jgi:proline racemase
MLASGCVPWIIYFDAEFYRDFHHQQCSQREISMANVARCAKMACLYADRYLPPGKVWRQEGILGTYFDGSVSVNHGLVIPSITGEAYVTGEAKLFFAENDPFRWGIS